MNLTLNAISIRGYRSIRSVQFPVRQLELFIGKNGVGKSNLVKAVGLLQHAAHGRIIQKIAAEGGVDSVFWSGTWPEELDRNIMLAAELGDFAYVIEIGAPEPGDPNLNWTNRQTGEFTGEPVIKFERIFDFQKGEPEIIMERIGQDVSLRTIDGQDIYLPNALLSSETVLNTFQDGVQFPQLEQIRLTIENWRFYHHFRTDRDAAIRTPCLPVLTPTLDTKGENLAATIATLAEFEGPAQEVQRIVAEALEGCELATKSSNGRISLVLTCPETSHIFKMHEISDGILQFLCLTSALLSLRPPSFMVLNEPETSLHTRMLPLLAELVTKAAKTTRIWIVTHSRELIAALEKEGFEHPREIRRINTETVILDENGEPLSPLKDKETS